MPRVSQLIFNLSIKFIARHCANSRNVFIKTLDLITKYSSPEQRLNNIQRLLEHMS